MTRVETWLPLGFASLLGVGAILLANPENVAVGYTRAQAATSALAIGFGVWAFWRHGGRQVTGAGVYSLASAVFVGYAGLWWLNHDGSNLSASLFAATSAGYLTHIAAYFLFWHRQSEEINYAPIQLASPPVSVWSTRIGLSTLLASIVLSFVAPGLSVGYKASAFAGILLFTLGLALRPRGVRFGLLHLGLVTAAIAAYVVTIFNGFGRLTVVTLCTACAMAVASRFKGRRVKLAMLVGVPLVALVLSRIRAATVDALYGSAAGRSQGGGSIESPLATFGRLIERSDLFAPGHGSTFWASATLYIPRSAWPGKPNGFGTVLTSIFEPQLLSVGHSMAALSTGEWYFNWGWIGVAAMVPALGISVQLIDRTLMRSLRRRLDTRRNLVLLAIAITLGAGLGDLVWVGTFTYAARTGFSVIFLALVLGLLAPGRRARTRRASRIARTGPGVVSVHFTGHPTGTASDRT